MGVEQLSSSFFKVQRVYPPGSQQADSGKIAAGMEATFRVTFTPESTASYEQQLVVSTERERFLVPLLALGAATALDLPDSITLPPTAAKKPSKHSLLVRNVGRAAGSFQLSTSASCFAVVPRHGQLAPGEAMQLTVEFTPERQGLHEGELEVLYGSSSRSTFTVLQGQGTELEVGLSIGEQVLQLPRVYMGKLSQRSFKVYNRSATSVAWSIRAQPSADVEMQAATDALAATTQLGTLHGTAAAAAAGHCSISGTLPMPPFLNSKKGSSSAPSNSLQSHRISVSSSGSSSRCSSGKCAEAGGTEECSLHRPSTASSSDCDTASLQSGSSLLGDQELAVMRLTKRVRRDICADQQLFSSPYFSVYPSEGCVQPNTEQEVIVQFSPDCAGSFEAVAWVDVQGRGGRLPLQLQAESLGPVVIFSYGDALDVGEAFVNTEQQYELELLNRSKVEAHWLLQHSHTRFGSKFAFSPDSGLLAPGQGQVISARLLADCLGRFDELFHVHLQGCSKPVTISIRGEIVGPQFVLDTQQLDFGIASHGFR